MTLKFDARQTYQLEAIRAVVDAFAGQPTAFATASPGTELGTGNLLYLSDEQILENVRAVQERNGIPPVEALQGRNFSVEMETGTGKTYVFLRTMYELHRTYGWTKFVLVVPSVAIREGAMSAIEMLREHFAELYGRVPLDVWAFRAEEAARLRTFAQVTMLQLLVLNVDAFNKKNVNVIYGVRDRTGPYAPIEYLRATRPVVILDEPQNMESETAREAVDGLAPLCTLRYSATHRNVYNLLYRLTPVDAYDLGLVKRIEVDSVLEAPDFNRPFVRVLAITPEASTVSARIEADVRTAGGTTRKVITVTGAGADLHDLTGGREAYRGYVVSEIDATGGFVAFANGVTVRQGEAHGGRTDEVMRIQIRETIARHFEKERRLMDRPAEERIKVLSLFFIDRVANYAPAGGKIRRWFEEEYEALSTSPRFAGLDHPPVEAVHNGYFAVTRKGEAKDSSGRTLADEDAYALIMRHKQRLLSTEEPLKFIFSHSALREGWDNPNVFQICTLNETRSELKKRQEIGRGLRLPVMANGERCHDERVNRLTVVANEAYDAFARKLQREIETEAGVSFDGRVANARARIQVGIGEGWRDSEHFRALWDRVKHRTRYRVRFETDELIERAASALAAAPPISPPRFVVSRAELEAVDGRLTARALDAGEAFSGDGAPYPIPDLLGHLQRETELTRSTLAAILARSGRLGEATANPQAFLDQAAETIAAVLRRTMIDGIAYELLAGQHYDPPAVNGVLEGYRSNAVEVAPGKSVADSLFVESAAERRVVEELNMRDDVRFFLELPSWFTVPTPAGDHHPGWAAIRDDGRCEVIDQASPRHAERLRCAARHFGAVEEVGYRVSYVVAS